MGKRGATSTPTYLERQGVEGCAGQTSAWRLEAVLLLLCIIRIGQKVQAWG